MLKLIPTSIYYYSGEIDVDNVAGVHFFREDLSYITYQCGDKQIYDNFRINPPVEAVYAGFCGKSTFSIKEESRMMKNELKRPSVVYVDGLNGLDSNDGRDKEHALKSFTRAFEITGEDMTVILIGDIKEQFNIGTLPKRHIKLLGEKGYLNRIVWGNEISIATLLEGETNLYYCTIDSFPQDEKFMIFQHEVNDEDTLILEAERHPLQRGKKYRCESLKIVRGESIEDVKSAGVYKFYYETESSTLYFKIKEGTNLAEHPIFIPTNAAVYGNNGTVLFEMENIEVLYGSVALTLSHGCRIVDCASKYAFGVGAWRWDNSIGVTFIRCEAARAFSGSSTGDGFNAHSTTGGTGEFKSTTAMLIDCWSHDNNDDGFSDHERCESIIRGGLFEYNCKGGITPSFGSHNSCFDVVSRKNYAGFFYTGKTEDVEGGLYGQMVCHNCIAIENNRGGSKAGFRVSGENNRMILYNCKAISNGTGYKTEDDTYCKAYDCYVKDESIAMDGNIEVINTDLLSRN